LGRNWQHRQPWPFSGNLFDPRIGPLRWNRYRPRPSPLGGRQRIGPYVLGHQRPIRAGCGERPMESFAKVDLPFGIDRRRLEQVFRIQLQLIRMPLHWLGASAVCIPWRKARNRQVWFSCLAGHPGLCIHWVLHEYFRSRGSQCRRLASSQSACADQHCKNRQPHRITPAEFVQRTRQEVYLSN